MSQSPTPDHEAFALLVADVFDAAGVLRRDGERIAARSGQTQARWQLLSVVSDGDWTVPMAADRLGVSRQAVQRIANELVADDLAVYRENPRHRRSKFLCLTDHGRRVLDGITADARRHQERLVAGLAGVDLVELRATVRHLTDVVRADLSSDAG